MTNDELEEMRRTCLRAVDHFGIEHQKRKAVEELGEILVELSREQDGRTDKDKIREELADVMIMAEQLRIIYGAQETDGWIRRKIERLRGMMRLPGRRIEIE